MIEISVLLQKGKDILKQNNIDISEARLLLAFVLNVSTSMLMTINECDSNIETKYFECIEKRVQGMPFAYIVGKQEFMKLPFIVTPKVLIPRPDTEILVQSAIDIACTMGKEKVNVLDMCTGSGCIAISISKYIDNSNVIGVDISQEALEIAQKNSELNNVEVTFIQSNLFENVSKTKFDIIVSNPPYIPTQDIQNLQSEVKNEPILALDGGKRGLDIYMQIISNAKDFLNYQGYLILEIGYNQAKDVKEMLQANGYSDIVVKKDLSNNDRVVISKI